MPWLFVRRKPRSASNATTATAMHSPPLSACVEAAPISAAACLRRSADAPQTGEIFHEISGGRNAIGGCGHPRGEFAGPGDVSGGKNPT